MALIPQNLDHTLIFPAHAAEMLTTTERHLKRLAARGELRPVHVGGKIRYRLSDLLQYIDELSA